MKTWIFDESKLDEAIRRWVDKQIELRHPKAIANAKFVDEAIKDMLQNDTELFMKTKINFDINRQTQIPDEKEQYVSTVNPSSKKAPDNNGLNLTIDELKQEWESMGQ